jgi:hypothetical protein
VPASTTISYNIAYNFSSTPVTAVRQSTIPLLPITSIQSSYPVDMMLVIPLANFAGYNTNISLDVISSGVNIWDLILTDAVTFTYYPADIPYA